MVIRILDLVSSCDTNDQGDVVKQAILDSLKSSDVVSVDFFGVTNVASSFVNSSFVSLLSDFDFGTLKSRIRIQRVNRQIGNMIKDRMASESHIPA
ncbi:MAG: DUF4325 domain-containing protein [Rhodobacterales bacterium]|nr:DUF4325 domain-containing protein [Rhodobacterales bacterium]